MKSRTKITLLCLLLIGAFGVGRALSADAVTERQTNTANTATGTSSFWVVMTGGDRGDPVSGSRTPPVAVATLPSAPAPTPTPHLVSYPLSSSQLASDSYIRMAHRMGMQPAVEEAKMLRSIHDTGLRIYDQDAVNSYLQEKTREDRRTIVWKPMRAVDQKILADGHFIDQGFKAENGFSISSVDQYSRAVPLQVMQRAKALQDCNPDAVFLVNDYEARRPDPFMAVTTFKLAQAGKIWVVAEWDEPAFEAKMDYQATPAPKPPSRFLQSLPSWATWMSLLLP